MTLQYKLDNEFELIFVVAFQKILQLAYIDKFLSDIHLEFRDKYKNELITQGREFCNFNFGNDFQRVLEVAEAWGKAQINIPRQMRAFKDSDKSKKTVKSMVIDRNNPPLIAPVVNKKTVKIVEAVEVKMSLNGKEEGDEENGNNENEMLLARKKLLEKFSKKPSTSLSSIKKSPKSPAEKKKKADRIWELKGNSKDAAILDRTKDRPEDMRSDFTSNNQMVGKLVGNIKDIEPNESSSEEDEDEDDEEDDSNSESEEDNNKSYGTPVVKKSRGMLSMFKGLVGSKSITVDDMTPVLDKLRDHLITKNVATDISAKLCTSVATKLEGKVLGTFETIAATVKSTLTDALVQILSPKRRIDILRDCLEAKRNNRPYVMAFCGVNGVGKSTNLAKICFWLIENNFNVLIAACDTFRAGAVVGFILLKFYL